MTADDDQDGDEDDSFAEWRDVFEKERLHFAAGRGDLPAVKELIAEGRDINAFDELSWTPLQHAAMHGHTDVVRYLIVNAHNEEKSGDTVLKRVAQTCSWEMAGILVDAGADPTIPGWMGLSRSTRASNEKRHEGPQVYELLLEAARRRHPHWSGFNRFSDRRPSRRKKKESVCQIRYAACCRQNL
jgi:ankyrin repeat protein